jgi:predicted AAA+ superfamily ATPase
MLPDTIIGRIAELELLARILKSSQAEFLAVYGRRRVGKTYLITTFLKNKSLFFEVTGLKDGDQKTQLKIFMKEIANTFLNGKMPAQPSDWMAALEILRLQIIQIPTTQKIVLFFDELPWIATAKSDFLAALDHYWNRYFSRMPNLILIVCGSAASWMIDNIISDTGGLYGRLTKTIRLEPFNLTDTEAYLNASNVTLDRKQIIELYMVMGGIPKYLNQVTPGQSTTQIINHQFFSGTGYLAGEFNKLYSSLFSNYEKHITVVRTLAKNSNGLARTDLLDKSGIGSGGTASKVLRELEESGFICRVNFYQAKKSLAKYRLIDQYSLFYLQWIESIERFSFANPNTNYWTQQVNSHAWQIWCGYAFENVCLMHVTKIVQALGLGGVQVNAYVWYTKGDNTKTGAQIDLLLDRADNCMNLCEIKYYNQEFTLTKKYAEDLERKKEIFLNQTGCKKSIFITLITTYGLIDNMHSAQYVQQHVTMDVLF